MKKDKINALVNLAILIIVFIAVSYFVQANSDYVKSLIDKTKVRDFAIVFVFIVIVGTVFVPLTFVPIVPLAVFSYGLIWTGILILIGEFIGAIISFGISRRWGLPLVTKLVSLEQIDRYEQALPEGNVFWAIVFIRIAFPLDVLSFILGLFSKIKFQTFAIATFLGLIPASFILAYLGSLELKYQLFGLVMFIIVILIGLGMDARYGKKSSLKLKVNNS